MATGNNNIQITITAQDLTSAVMNGVIQGMQQVNQSVQNIGTAAQTAAKQLQQAFSSLNMRSALDIENEKQKLIAAFNLIRTSRYIHTARHHACLR